VQGLKGGDGYPAGNLSAGGGGGCGSQGINGVNSASGNGGTGCTSSISGTSTVYGAGAGGGGRSGYPTSAGNPGDACAGASAAGSVAGSPGVNNRGCGGGGGGYGGAVGNGGNGGSGIVIVAYSTSGNDCLTSGTGNTITSVGGQTAYNFVSNGSLLCPSSRVAKYLLVGGGGGGGAGAGGSNNASGGGGAAGQTVSGIGNFSGTIPILIGAGGAGGIHATAGTGSAGGTTTIGCVANTQGGGSDANVLGLWHMDNSGTDNSSAGTRGLTLNGTAAYSATQAKFGGSLKIVATGDYAGFPGTSLSLTGDFTAEAWLYMTAVPANYFGWIGDDQATNLLAYSAPALGSQIASTSATITATIAVFTPNAWHHVAWERQGGNLRIFLDGVEQAGSPKSGLPTSTAGGSATTWKIGRAYSNTYMMPANSYMDEVRVSNMVRYTGNFTPQGAPFCNPGTASSVSDGAVGGAGGANNGSTGGSGYNGGGAGGQNASGGAGVGTHFNGGTGFTGTNYGAGAGAGDGGPGGSGTGSTGGTGGIGVTPTGFGLASCIAGGGAGGTYNGGTTATATCGGGNAGTAGGDNQGVPGAPNTGGGAGGNSEAAAASVKDGSIGGSGEVIIVEGGTIPGCTVSGTGNTATVVNGFNRYTMTSSGTITCAVTTTVRYCIVAGGGGGGNGSGGNGAGGGGGGGMFIGSGGTLANGANAITVGAGGPASTVGANTTAIGFTANGGGAGGNNSAVGGNGGAGGGGGQGSPINAGGLGSQGGNGGSSGGVVIATGGGGGGGGPSNNPGANATDVASGSGGKGGDGTVCPIDGTTYAGGGGGEAPVNFGAGGAGGGGAGGAAGLGTAGAANTGGGAGGSFSTGVAGGSGKVIIDEGPPPSPWQSLVTIAPGSDNTGWNSFGVRQWIGTGAYGSPNASSQVRVSIRSGSVALVLSDVFVGHSAGPTGTATQNYDGSQVRVTWSGANGVTIPVNSTVVSDAINYAFDPSKDLIVGINVTSGATQVTSNGGTNFQEYHNASQASCPAPNTSCTYAFAAPAGNSYFVAKVETAGAGCTANTQGGGTFANTLGLWHFDNNGTDSSGNSRTLSLVSGAVYSNTQSKFGGYSGNNVTTSSTFVAATSPAATTGDLTMEGWFYLTSAATQFVLYEDYLVGNNVSFTLNYGQTNSGAFTLGHYINPTSGLDHQYGPWAWTPVTNTWTQFAVVRKSGTWSMFINGTTLNPTAGVTGSTDSIWLGASFPLLLGNAYSGGSPNVPGFLDEFRISNVARYSTGINFTPQPTAFCNN
jgi:hypothetical protein